MNGEMFTNKHDTCILILYDFLGFQNCFLLYWNNAIGSFKGDWTLKILVQLELVASKNKRYSKLLKHPADETIWWCDWCPQ